MTQWGWLDKRDYRWGFALRVVLKAALLFVLANLVFAFADPMDEIGSISVYNTLVPGRLRLPYGGDNAAEAYTLSLNSLNAMFASQTLAQRKAPDEFRVVMLGDSGTWGYLLPPEDTLSANLNRLSLTTDDGRALRFYNVAYPEVSAMKDLLLLDKAMQHQPDLIVWLLTLESLVPERQVSPVIVNQNTVRVFQLDAVFGLPLSVDEPRFARTTFLDQTIIGRRRELADWLRLQLYGFGWATTGVDQVIPETYTLRRSDFDEDTTWQGNSEAEGLQPGAIALPIMDALIERAGDVPVLIVNEPMFVSSGVNSDLRYNFFYPRWAYDAWRVMLADLARERGWNLLDVWDALPPDAFTDSPIHYDADGSRQLAEILAPEIIGVS